LEAAACYRAVRARDARFDGRFFTAVSSTGIYCRPICPARTPRFENVRFYACAAAAESAGFRACRRCRPEAAPGSPAWMGTSATVTRAFRLIEAGALDTASVGELADRVGVGSRQLRRLFLEHLGATPVAVAQTRRVHFAKKLINETSLSMTDVAMAAGFGSVRRFNSAMKRAFDRPPSELRRKAPVGDGLTLELSYRPPLDFAGIAEFLRPRIFAGIETVDAAAYRRLVRHEDEAGWIEVRPDGDRLLLSIPLPLLAAAASIAARTRRLFDLGCDPLAIHEHLSTDALLRPRLRLGVRVPGCFSTFELVVRCILGQQVSVAAATTLSKRFIERFGHDVAGERVFPTPSEIAAADVSVIGVPKRRAEAIAAVARAIDDGLDLGDPEAADALGDIRGIGPWSVGYIRMRLGDPDGFPTADLGLLRGLDMNKRALAAHSERWRPWRAYGAMAVWTA